jgi:serine/threonine protein kinase
MQNQGYNARERINMKRNGHIPPLFYRDNKYFEEEIKILQEENIITLADRPNMFRKYHEGSYGIIYYGHDNQGKIRIIKHFKTDSNRYLDSVNLNEIYLNNTISCPYVARFITFGYFSAANSDESMLYGVMRHYGKNVAELIALDWFAEIDEFIIFARGLYAALASLHQAGYVHGDISAANVLLNRRTKKIKLIDCGFTKLAEDKSSDIRGAAMILKTIFPHTIVLGVDSSKYRWHYYVLMSNSNDANFLLSLIPATE